MKLVRLIGNSLKKHVSDRSIQAFAIALLASLTVGASAQVFPNFPAGTANSSTLLEYGAGIVPFGSGLYPNALFMAYVNGSQENNIGVAYSLNGTTYTNFGSIVDSSTGSRYNVNCSASTPATCAPAVITFKSKAYIAFADQTTGGLDVVQVSQIASNAAWSYSLIHTDTTVKLTSAPTMIASPDGVHLLIRYGTSNTSQKNSTYVTSFDGSSTWSTYASGGYAPTQSAMVVLASQIYAVDKQNNSDNGVWVTKLDNNGNNLTGGQISGWATGAGFSATVYKNNIVVAFQQDASSNYLWVFSSPNGSSWTGQEYTSNQIGATPAIAAYNGGVALVYKSNDSSNWLFANFGQ
jgi:hypothetical protein